MPNAVTPPVRKCQSCGADIIWLKTSGGRAMPVNAETVKPGYTTFDKNCGHISHFATCPQANKWRKQEPAP